MIRIFTLAIFAMLLSVSCGNKGGTPTPIPATLTVGMSRDDATRSLKQAGAKPSEGASLPSDPSGLEDGEAWDLRDGNLVEIQYSRASASDAFNVKGLNVCDNPNEPVGLRRWTSVSDLKI